MPGTDTPMWLTVIESLCLGTIAPMLCRCEGTYLGLHSYRMVIQDSEQSFKTNDKPGHFPSSHITSVWETFSYSLALFS